MKNSALFIAGIIFGLIALGHLIRLYAVFEVTVAGIMIPTWVSVVGFIVGLILCIWMFVAFAAKR